MVSYTIIDEIEKDLLRKETDNIDFYTEELRQEMLENEEITPEEEAFMRGYDSAE